MLRFYAFSRLALIITLVLAASCTPALSPAWQPHNNGLPAGVPVLALTGDPASPQTLFAGTYDETGLYRSKDGGDTWSPVAHGLPPRPVYALLAPPAHPGVILAGTGDGLYRSTDSGATWVHLLAEPTRPPFVVYAFGYDERGAIYLGGDQNTLLRSDDGGATWIVLPPIAAELSVLSLVYIPTGALLLAGSDRMGVYFSEDRGESWQRSEGMDRTAVAGLLVVAPDDGNLVLARGRQGLWRSEDSGRNWQSVPIEPTGRIDAVASTGDQLYFLTNEGMLYQSSDQGRTWTPHGAGLGRSGTVHFLQPTPGAADALFAGTEHRLYRTTDAGQTWQPLAAGLGAPAADRLAVSPDGTFLLANGDGLFRSGGWGEAWQPVEGLPPGGVYTVAVSPREPRRVYAATQRHGLWRSEDGGLSWQPTGLEHAAPGMVLHPDDPERIFVHVIYERVYESRDGAQSWDPRWEGMDLSTEVISLTLDPCRPERLFAGATATLFRSEDGATTWQPIAPALNGQTVFAVLTDCDNPDLLWAGATNGLYRSTDGGARWSAVTGLEGTTVTAIARDPRQPRYLWAGTKYRGLYQSTDGGATWSPTGLDGVSINQLLSAPDGQWVAAATTQGVWYAVLNS